MVKTRFLVSGLVLALALLACVQASSQTSGSKDPRAGEPRPEPVLRLTFESEDGRLRLLDVQELRMVLPATVRERVMEADERPSGYALELRGPQAETLLVEELDDPFRLVSETPDPEDPDRIERRETRLESATFSVLVPAPPEARSVVLMRPAPGQEELVPEQRRLEEWGAFELESYKPRGDG